MSNLVRNSNLGDDYYTSLVRDDDEAQVDGNENKFVYVHLATYAQTPTGEIPIPITHYAFELFRYPPITLAQNLYLDKDFRLQLIQRGIIKRASDLELIDIILWQLNGTPFAGLDTNYLPLNHDFHRGGWPQPSDQEGILARNFYVSMLMRINPRDF